MIGSAWAHAAYDHNGNMTTVPQPANPSAKYTGSYDAWNRLVKLADPSTGNTVQTNDYDGRKYRTIRSTYTAGVLPEARHYYHTAVWQTIEERLGSSASPNQQSIAGLRRIDDLLLRDRDPTGAGPLSERLYAMADPNWNTVAIANSSGSLQERYAYNAYGIPTILASPFTTKSLSAFSWDTLFAGYRQDILPGTYIVRNRTYVATTGTWSSAGSRRICSWRS